MRCYFGPQARLATHVLNREQIPFRLKVIRILMALPAAMLECSAWKDTAISG
jgi:hypothetical protein